MKVTPLRKWLMAVAILGKYGNSATTIIGVKLLDHYNAKSGRCDPSYGTLAKGCGVNRWTAMRAAQQLESDGWLTITQRKSSDPDRVKANISSSFAFDWKRVNIKKSKKGGGVDATTHGDAEITRVVAPRNGGGGLSVTAPSEVQVTQNLEIQTLNETCESKLPLETEKIADKGSSIEAFERLVESLPNSHEWPEGNVQKANNPDHALRIVRQASTLLLGYHPQSNPRIGGNYADEYIMEHFPRAALHQALTLCAQGTLSRRDLGRALLGAGIPHA